MNSESHNKSIVMYSSYAEKRVNLNLEYKGLPAPVIKELTALLGVLSEKTKGSVCLSVINGRGAVIETFASDDGMEALNVDVKAEVDGFIRVNEDLLDSVGKFHYLYLTPEGAEFRKTLADGTK